MECKAMQLLQNVTKIQQKVATEICAYYATTLCLKKRHWCSTLWTWRVL